MYNDYINFGWSLVPISPLSKKPAIYDWGSKDAALKTDQLPEGYNVGIAHVHSGTCAFDIDDYDLAKTILLESGIRIDDILGDPSAVHIRSGKPGRDKILYRMPPGVTLTTKIFKRDNKTAFELRCATSYGTSSQDLLPPSIHPDTMQPYTWQGDWKKITTIPDHLLDFWKVQLNKHDARTISNEGVRVSMTEVKGALESISPDCDRQTWIHCGMALHSTLHEDAFNVFDEWSAKSSKYPGKADLAKQWRSFKREGINIGTLYHYAIEAGWTKPAQDYSDLFKPVSDAPPKLLEDLRIAPPTLDLNLLPPVLARRAQEVATIRGCDPVIPAWAGIAAACAVADCRSRLSLIDNDFKVPPLLWVMVVGSPGDKKSPGSDIMFSVLEEIEREAIPDYQARMLEYEGREAAWASSRKAYLDYCASPEAMLGSNDAPAVLDQPVKPASTLLKVTDITSQKLVRQIAERPRGVACILDEMGSWINKVCDPKSGDDRSAWTVGYEARSYRMDRVGDGSIYAENYAVSMYGNIQPRLFNEKFKHLAADGLLQRFIPISAMLQDKVKSIGQQIPDFLQNRQQYETALRLVYSLPPQAYTLSEPAQAEFHAFRVWYYDERDRLNLLDLSEEFMTAYSKLEGTCGRLALVMHLLENPFSGVVSHDTLKRAVMVVKTYIIPSLRHTLSEAAGRDNFGQWLINWVCVRALDHDEVNLADIRTSARSQLAGLTQWRAEQKILCEMELLEQAGYVARLDDGSRILAHSAAWALNKQLPIQFKDYVKAVVAAKAADRAHQYRHSRTGKAPPVVAGQRILSED